MAHRWPWGNRIEVKNILILPFLLCCLQTDEPENELISSLFSNQATIDSKMGASEMSIFKVSES